MEPFGIALGLFTLLVTVFIARGQWKQAASLQAQTKQIEEQTTKLQEQAAQLEEIESETNSVAKEIHSTNARQRQVRAFFHVEDERAAKFICHFPVYWYGTPLPSIVAGDFQALHTLRALLGDELLELRLVNADMSKSKKADAPPKRATKHHKGQIFLCSTTVNSELRDRFPSVKVSGNSAKLPAGLPCWFAEVPRTDSSASNAKGGTRTKSGAGIKKAFCIENGDSHFLLFSPSEAEYDQARKLGDGQPYTPSGKWVRDYGLIARFHDRGELLIVVAGLHQYGTWIAATVFEDLMDGKRYGFGDVFDTDKDFVCLVWGWFETESLSVVRSGVLEEYVWCKPKDTWKQAAREPGARDGHRVDPA